MWESIWSYCANNKSSPRFICPHTFAYTHTPLPLQMHAYHLQAINIYSDGSAWAWFASLLLCCVCLQSALHQHSPEKTGCSFSVSLSTSLYCLSNFKAEWTALMSTWRPSETNVNTYTDRSSTFKLIWWTWANKCFTYWEDMQEYRNQKYLKEALLCFGGFSFLQCVLLFLHVKSAKAQIPVPFYSTSFI